MTRAGRTSSVVDHFHSHMPQIERNLAAVLEIGGESVTDAGLHLTRSPIGLCGKANPRAGRERQLHGPVLHIVSGSRFPRAPDARAESEKMGSELRSIAFSRRTFLSFRWFHLNGKGSMA